MHLVLEDNKGYKRVCCVSFVLFCVGIVYVSVDQCVFWRWGGSNLGDLKGCVGE